eukprot:UN09836
MTYTTPSSTKRYQEICNLLETHPYPSNKVLMHDLFQQFQHYDGMLIGEEPWHQTRYALEVFLGQQPVPIRQDQEEEQDAKIENTMNNNNNMNNNNHHQLLLLDPSKRMN